jgi:ABC-type antimicrobial peptide transport system permease subunit
MLKNYFTAAIRSMMRDKGASLINIAGLTLGITCSLILFLLVKHTLSYDNFHSKRDRIYRVVSESEGNRGKRYSPGIPTVLPDALRSEFPELEEVVFTSYRSEAIVTIPQPGNAEPKKFLEEDGAVFTEPSFFKIFDRPILLGTANNSLDEPGEAIISKRWALKYFGKIDARNEIIKHDTIEYRIAAIMEDAPSNTDLPFELMLSYATIEKESKKSGWNSIWSDEQCYFLLREGQKINSVSARLPAFTKKYLGDHVNKAGYILQSLRDLHYDDRFSTYSHKTVSRGMLISLQAIALILILTACINFINLATAEAVKRSKEVGVRKVLGSSRGQLIRQFLGETTLITTVSVLASLGLTQFFLTFLNPFLDTSLALNLTTDVSLWIYLFAVTISVSLLAGLYPAFVVSSINPVMALKALINRNTSGYSLRRMLVVSQFVISQFFIIGTIVVINQMNYFKRKDLGFNKDAMLIIPVHDAWNNISKVKTLRNELQNLPGIQGVSLGSAPPSSGHVSNTNFTVDGIEETYVTQVKQVDGNYIGLYGLDVIAGKAIEDHDTARGYVVNEKFVNTLGLSPDEVIGREVELWHKKLPIVGVVKDFHTVSLRQPIEATVLMNNASGYETISLNVEVNRIKQVIDAVKPVWESAYPDHIFTYSFLDQEIAEFYEDESKMSVMFSIFSGIAIFIGCLGLYGLATFMANQKTKEVGVRKALGASVANIMILFCREYIKLILVGFVLAAPIGWYVMNKFIEELTYKEPIGISVFVLALSITISIALATVGYRSAKAATANPVHSLRTE